MQRFSLWLQPSKSDNFLLQDVLFKLAKEYQTPLFEPHLTLLSGCLDPEDFLEQTFFKKHPPFSVKIKVLNQSQRFFQPIFLEIAENRALTLLRQQCLQKFKMTNVTIKHPHVSLLYGKFVKKERQVIMKSLNLKLFKKIEFNKISLVITEGMVEKWKKVKTVHLRKS